MSPETLMSSAPVSQASDIWSLGACTYMALTGELPFKGDAIGSVVLKVCAQAMPVPSKVNPRVPLGFDEWFAKACNRNPSERFGSARELAIALQQLEQLVSPRQEVVTYEIRPQPGASEMETLPPPGPNKGVVLAAALGGMALVFALGALYVAKLKHDTDEAIIETATSADAVVDAENERKLRESERLVFGTNDGGAAAAADAGAASPGNRKARSR
jgi:serine/threonine protein kinase